MLVFKTNDERLSGLGAKPITRKPKETTQHDKRVAVRALTSNGRMKDGLSSSVEVERPSA